MSVAQTKSRAPAKFEDPEFTADGERRAQVDFQAMRTLWINTGTLCNLACTNCYIESSPKNDALVYISLQEVARYLDELDELGTGREVGFTGGEPFMNPQMTAILEDTLRRGYRALVLTNAMRPMMKQGEALKRLNETYGDQLVIRVSVDHYSRDLHEEERGHNTWAKMVDGLKWLADNGFQLDIAGRTRWGEDECGLREGYARLFGKLGVPVDAHDPEELLLFPEMDPNAHVPEITTACWGKLGIDPSSIMCASSRMVVKRKGWDRPGVVACTLIPYDREFEFGETLRESMKPVKLNHINCAKFCVLGGGSCS
ncbi:4Fe-4S single cluster domain-containing protein [Limimonas halophila]|uniref:4Fe-4S single cluster domain-containing protein n=1 Tax=Limimonas halophila TaxID=1082479 RepID=A0A1G7RBL4_9PROT|nr:radical SAM protein [Limimonas halophila]SDG08142.1 4Fe-4S single cluster domain-containing protein [Limimonas halophila]